MMVFSELTRSQKRALLSFWIFGICNNFGYVIMLSAAVDLISKSDDGSSYCGPKSTGAILLADILPSFGIKAIAPLFINKIHYNVKVTGAVLISLLSFLVVASVSNYSLIIIGVCLAALSAGIGEITFLAMTSHFDKAVVTAWSSGTGFAGILGATVYLGLSLLLTPSQSIYIMVVVPVIEFITYWFILIQPATFNERERSKRLLPDEEDEPTEALILTDEDEHQRPFVKLYTAVQELKYFMSSLFLVYAAEYLINQGTFEIIWFRDMAWSRAVQYRVYQVVYQVGVTISRSSASLVHIKQIHILSILQCVNLVFFAFEARFSFTPHISIILLLILWEGLLGGACYVNAFYAIYQQVPHHKREYALGLASVSDSTGIVCAGILATILHNFICKFRVQ